MYGEILIDDMKWAFDENDNPVPARVGGLAGFYYPHAIGAGDFRFEYARVNRFTYSHWQETTDYVYKGQPLGHKIGTDADSLILEYTYPVAENKYIAVKYQVERHGEGEIGDRWDVSQPPVQFLTGIVEKKRQVDVGCSFGYNKNISFTLVGWVKSIDNYQHILNNKTTHAGVNIRVGLAF